MRLIISLLLSWCTVSECFNPDITDSSHNYTKVEMYSKLFDETGYPEQGDIPLLNRKVFRGTRVTIREHPYVVSVRRRVSHYCMGTLLTKNLIVTVAHPLADVPINELSVVVGENYADRGAALLTVVLLIIHELFDRYTLANDIALLRIFEDQPFRGSVKSIELVAPLLLTRGTKAFVTGWGRCDRTGRELCLPRTSKYFPGETLDPMLRSISFIINEPNYYCNGYKRNDISIVPGMLCLGVAREEDPVTPCLAVPGAPLVVNARLAALQSWGFGCGYTHDLPLIYTSIQYHQPWISHNIQIIRNISQTNLMSLLQATKAHILLEWLKKTRLHIPEEWTYPDEHVELLKVDRQLIKLRGNIYDIRDYLYEGLHSKCKAKMQKKLQEKLEKNKMAQLYVTKDPRLTSVKAFLVVNKTDIDQALNATDANKYANVFDENTHRDDFNYEDSKI